MRSATQIDGISASDLQEMLTSSVRAGLQRFKEELERENKELNDPERLLNPTEVCELLGISKPTLWNWVKAGKLIAYAVGQKRFYKYAEVLKALEKQNTK